MSTTEETPKKRASLAPPPPPKRKPAPEPEAEESEEQSVVEQIREKLEDANQAVAEAYELLGELEE